MCNVIKQLGMSNLYVFGHDLIVSQLQLIHTGLASGQGMALLQPFTPYVEAVGSWVSRQLRHVADCIGLSLPGNSFWQLLDKPHPAVFVGFCMVYLHASNTPSNGGLAD